MDAQKMRVVDGAVSTLLSCIEPDTFNREGLVDTPNRVARLYREMFHGYEMDAKDILSATFENDQYDDTEPYNNSMVIVKDIEFYSHCEHHMVPFYGTVSIGYIPSVQVVGLSKLVRLTDMFAKRLQIQERMTAQIANAIEEHLAPLGVVVVIKAKHLCMGMRGVKKPDSVTVTSTVRGLCKNADTRSEFLALIGERV